MTDWQIQHLYFLPEAEKAKRMKKETGQGTETLEDDAPTSRREETPDEETFVRQWTARFGGSPEHWRNEYRTHIKGE